MNPASRVSVQWPVLVIAAVVLFVAGAGVAYLALRSSAQVRPRADEHAAMPASPPRPDGATSEPASRPGSAGPLPDVVVTLSPEAIARAGITTAAASLGTRSGGLRAPGVVDANAYKQVVVTPVVSGRITRVMADLGQQVRLGQTLAQIFSPELAESQTRYIAARAELEAHEQELARTEKLAEIGAASRQELERVHAEHTSRRAGVDSAASRLRLLGLSADAIEALRAGKDHGATANVPAPISGVVTERLANVGLNVDQATQLFYRRRSVVGLGRRQRVRERFCPRARGQSSDGHDHGLSRVGLARPGELHRSAGQPPDADRERASGSAERAQ